MELNNIQPVSKEENFKWLSRLPGMICCWDFGSEKKYQSKSRHAYTLLEGNTAPTENTEGIIGKGSIEFTEGQYLYIPRADCESLNIYGKNAAVTVLCWLKRKKKSRVQCEAVAGMWNETEKKRQYCLFLNLRLFDSADQVCGHISGVGGPTPGEKYCVDAAIGQHPLEMEEWHFTAFTYDGKMIRAYLDGLPDTREERNPYIYDAGIFDGGKDGADFTVGAVHRSNEMGNHFVGNISGLAVLDRALSESEIRDIQVRFPLNRLK